MQVLALSKWNFIAVNTFSLHTRKQSRTLSIIKSNNMVGIYIITQYFSGLLKHYIILGKYDCKKPEYYAYQFPCIIIIMLLVRPKPLVIYYITSG